MKTNPFSSVADVTYINILKFVPVFVKICSYHNIMLVEEKKEEKNTQQLKTEHRKHVSIHISYSKALMKSIIPPNYITK